MSTAPGLASDRDARRRGRGPIFGTVWLIFMTSPVSEALAQHPGGLGRALVIAITVAFCGLYVALMLFGLKRHPRWLAVTILVGLTTLSAAFCVLAEAGLFTFVYLAAAGTAVLPIRWAVPWVGSLVVLTVVLPSVVPGWEVDATGTLAVALSAVASFGFVQLLRRNWELRQAHDEIARLAVADERLRFSRDLHDLLGHSLTVITVKAELAGRLVERAPDRATDEIQDVERLAREALADVRATVAGYRATSLAAEITQARRSLEAAGITPLLPTSVDEVAGQRREVFGWVVREGVTNVVRHSRARTCCVRLTPTSVEIVDDGVGTEPPNGPSHPAGHGLAGLDERVRAAGGTLTAGPLTTGGFRLSAQVPATATAASANGTDATSAAEAPA